MNFSVIIILFSFLFPDIDCFESSQVSGWECVIDATDWDEWIYINLDIRDALPSSAIDTPGWDIACKRYNFRTNSGLSGIGNGGAYVDSVNIWSNYIV